MAMSWGMMGSMGALSSSIGSRTRRGGVLNGRRKAGRSRGEVRCAAAAASLGDHYRTLRVRLGASEKEVKRAYRKLALQYHPDVCKGSNCGVQFHRINEAYDIVISSMRQTEEDQEQWQQQEWSDDEWMGWEGAWHPDYSSHFYT